MVSITVLTDGKKLKRLTQVQKRIQCSPKIMHAQELLFAFASRLLLAASCGSLALGSCKPQELLSDRIFEAQELLAVGFLNHKNFFVLILYVARNSGIKCNRKLTQYTPDSVRHGQIKIFPALTLRSELKWIFFLILTVENNKLVFPHEFRFISNLCRLKLMFTSLTYECFDRNALAPLLFFCSALVPRSVLKRERTPGSENGSAPGLVQICYLSNQTLTSVNIWRQIKLMLTCMVNTREIGYSLWLMPTKLQLRSLAFFARRILLL